MIKSVKKSLDIMIFLSSYSDKPVKLGVIAEKLKINKSTCSHIIKTLCESLFVEQVSRTEGYRLGPNAYYLVRNGLYQESLIKLFLPVLKWLRIKLDATVLLSIVCDGVKYIIYRIEGEEHLDSRRNQIIRGNITATATGRIMMAYMNKEELERVIKNESANIPKNWPGSENHTMLKSRLEKIRTDGYVNVPDTIKQRQSYAFPIWDGIRLHGSVGIVYPDKKDTVEYRKSVICMAKKATDEIHRRLVFSKM